MKSIIKFFFGIAVILGAVFVIIKFIFPIYEVETTVMEPTLHKGEYVMTFKYNYMIFPTQQNELVTIIMEEKNNEPAMSVVKRIVAIPSQVAVIDKKTLEVNEVEALFPQINEENQEIEVGTNEIFVKGDNVKGETELKNINDIIGKVIYTFKLGQYQKYSEYLEYLR